MGNSPGLGTSQSATPRKVLASPNLASFLPGGKIISGANSRDPGNTNNIDVIRAGMIMGKRNVDDKYAPSILGLLTTALAVGGGTVVVGALAGDEIARRIGVGGTFKLVGCPQAAVDEVQTFTTDATATGGTFTIGFNGDSTSVIAYDATATQVNTAIALMEDLAAGDIVLTAGDEIDTATTMVFTLASTLLTKLGLTEMPMLTIDIDSTSTTAACEGVRTTKAEAINMVRESRALSLSAEAAGSVTLAANTAVAEVQNIALGAVATAGTYTISYKGETTAAIDFDATVAQVLAALELLSTVNPGDITPEAAHEVDTEVESDFTFADTLGDVGTLSYDITNLTGPTENTHTTVTPGEYVAYATTLHSFAIGSLVMPTDGSEDPKTILIEETGIKVTDINGDSEDKEMPKVLVAGQICHSGIIDYPSDGPTQVWLKEELGPRFVFDDDF